jgi:hypothetical protein
VSVSAAAASPTKTGQKAAGAPASPDTAAIAAKADAARSGAASAAETTYTAAERSERSLGDGPSSVTSGVAAVAAARRVTSASVTASEVGAPPRRWTVARAADPARRYAHHSRDGWLASTATSGAVPARNSERCPGGAARCSAPAAASTATATRTARRARAVRDEDTGASSVQGHRADWPWPMVDPFRAAAKP